MVQLPKESMLYCLTRALPSILFSLYAKMFVTYILDYLTLTRHRGGHRWRRPMWNGPRGTTATSRCELHRGGSEPTSRRQLAQASHGVIHGGREGWWIWVKLCERCIKVQLHTWQVTWYRSCLVYRFRCCSQNVSHVAR